MEKAYFCTAEELVRRGKDVSIGRTSDLQLAGNACL